MYRIIVAGIDTGVGKTIVSAILTTLFDGDYWKPIQSGNEKDHDTTTIKKWIDINRHFIHPAAYSFKAPLSPHHAARLEKTRIEIDTITLPKVTRPLIIESVGGILVPLTTKTLTIDLFASWDSKWIVVSRHYLGSINHTLLTIEALKQRQLPVLGLIFNGEPNLDSETAILENSQIPFLGRLLPETYLNKKTIQRYVKQWQRNFMKLLH